mmetsp:Transcript_5171/g.9241  ORF Transcript_5171/g.9241 Transcript_5171/m.9241 type:complete len:262 (-) Transcript_5171:529-1314(-)
MKLDEFHVLDESSGSGCHGYPVTSRHLRVCGLRVDLSATSGGNHSALAHKSQVGSFHQVDRIATVATDVVAVALLLLFVAFVRHRKEVQGKHVLMHPDFRMPQDLFDKSLLDRCSGGVRCMNHSGVGVSTLLAQVQDLLVASSSFFPLHCGERDANLAKHLHLLGAFPAHDFHCLSIVQVAAGIHGVFHVMSDAVLSFPFSSSSSSSSSLTHHRRNASLRVFGAALHDIALRDNDNLGAIICRLQRTRESSDAASKHKQVT